MKCYQCGSENQEDAEFCNLCMTRLSPHYSARNENLIKKDPYKKVKTILIYTLIFLIVLSPLFYFYFPKRHYTYVDSQSSISVLIIGNKSDIDQATEAIDLLKRKAPKYYRIVIKVEVIEYLFLDLDWALARAYAFEKPQLVTMGSQTKGKEITLIAGILVHEATHIRLYNEYVSSHIGVEEVPDEAWGGINGETKAFKEMAKALEMLDYKDKRFIQRIKTSPLRGYDFITQ